MELAQVCCTIGAVVKGKLEYSGYEDEVDEILQCLFEVAALQPLDPIYCR